MKPTCIWLFSFCFRYAITKALCIAFMMTFFSVFDVPVFWPILLCYWVVLFVLTMKRQILHMIKYKYVPFNLGKQVSTVFNCLIDFLSLTELQIAGNQVTTPFLVLFSNNQDINS
jgi:Rer1 family